jgi:hypothetical protein
MDACLMSNLEVAYQVRPHVRYIVASEELEPNEGWPYDRVLQLLIDEPDVPTPELASHIVSAYVKSYRDRNYTSPVTQAALDPSKIDEVAGALDKLAGALIAEMPAAADYVWKAQRKSTHFFFRTLWDIVRFCEELEKLTDSDDVRTASAKVREVLDSGPGRFVLGQDSHGESVKGCCGVSVYFLPPLDDISRYYAELDFAKDHRWLQMLQAYHAS